MMGEELQSMIAEHRRTAEAAGQVALEAMSRGDIGMARTAARQAAQWARVVMQLETAGKEPGPQDADASAKPTAPASGKISN